jgi:hypothetical protein
MAKNYLSYKEGKKNFALKGVWVLVILAVVFAVILFRFALSNTQLEFSAHAPDNDEAYAIAKQFIKPTIKSNSVSFPESGYQCAQKPDSVYIIKSYAESKGKTDAKNVITFEVTLKYKGGEVSAKENWILLNLNEN